MKKLLILLLLSFMFSSCVRKAIVQLDEEHRNIEISDPTNDLAVNDTIMVSNYNGGKWELVDLSNLVRDTIYETHGVVIAYRIGVVKEIRK